MLMGAAVLLTLLANLPEAQARQKALEHHRAGEAHMSAERFEEAASEFRNAIALDPLLVLAHYNLGQSCMALRRYPEAATAYESARDAVLQIGHMGEKERAERERANKDEVHEIRSTIAGLRGGQIKVSQPEMAILRLEERMRVLESMELRGRERQVRVPPEIDLALGSAYFRQQKLPEAEKSYRDAVRGNDRLGAAHNNLAVIYMLTGRFDEAQAAIRSAEAAGFRVSDQFKADLRQRQAKAAN